MADLRGDKIDEYDRSNAKFPLCSPSINIKRQKSRWPRSSFFLISMKLRVKRSSKATSNPSLSLSSPSNVWTGGIFLKDGHHLAPIVVCVHLLPLFLGFLIHDRGRNDWSPHVIQVELLFHFCLQVNLGDNYQRTEWNGGRCGARDQTRGEKINPILEV